MIRYSYILAIAFKNLFNNKSKALAIAIPLALIIAIVSAVSFYIEGVKRDALLAAQFSPDILLQQQVGGRTESLFYARYATELREIDGIKAYFPRVWGHINFTDRKKDNKTFVVMGLDPERIASGLPIDLAIEKGRSLNSSGSQEGIMGHALAKALGCDVGDTVEISTPSRRTKVPVKVVGLFNSAVQIYTADLLFVHIQTARKIMGFYDEDETSDILVYVRNPVLSRDIAVEIAKRIEGAKPLTKADMLSLTEQSFGQKSGFFHLIWFILLANIIIIAWSLMSHISFSLQKEIGILKAIGWDIGHIMALKTTETFLMAIFSVLVGLSLGIVYMIMDAPGLKSAIIGWADIYPDFPIPLFIEIETVLLIAALGIFPLLAGTLIPVWRLGIIEPDEAIRK